MAHVFTAVLWYIKEPDALTCTEGVEETWDNLPVKYARMETQAVMYRHTFKTVFVNCKHKTILILKLQIKTQLLLFVNLKSELLLQFYYKITQIS